MSAPDRVGVWWSPGRWEQVASMLTKMKFLAERMQWELPPPAQFLCQDTELHK